jgi:ABC-type lipoprotein export system ATPase subunit
VVTFIRNIHYNSDSIEKDKIGKCFTWIKAKTNFSGLYQILFENDRIFVGKEPGLKQRIKTYPNKFIKSLDINKVENSKLNEEWFDKTSIDFNGGLVALIGKKGNGKSAIADILGLCCNSKNDKEFLSFLHKDKFRSPKNNKAKEFIAKVKWYDGLEGNSVNLNSEFNPIEEEKAKYIPQNYLEKLCINEEQTEFEDELKKIIFAHIPKSKRLNQNTLEDLIKRSRDSLESGIGQLKLEIESLNSNITRLEAKRKPSYKQTILQQIASKEAELISHDTNKPVDKLKPEENPEEKEKNEIILKKIESTKASIGGYENEKEKIELELNSNNVSQNELAGFNAELNQAKALLQKFVEKFKPVLAKYAIKIEDVISYSVRAELITEITNNLTKRKSEIELELNGNESSNGLTLMITNLKKDVLLLQGQLAQSQKEYQVYLQEKENWDNRKKEIIGSKEVVNSLEFYKNELNNIETSIVTELSLLYERRKKAFLDIYNLKKQLLEIYTSLYQPVMEVLKKESGILDEYNIKVNAGLVIKAFTDRFLNYVNQKSRGSFSGSLEGREVIENFLAVSSVSTAEELQQFVEGLIERLKFDKRQGYNNESREIDEQLKRDISLEELYNFIFQLEFIEPQFKLQLGNKDLKELSPGERGAILLIFYLFLDIDNKPLIIDQPEENLDNESIYHYLVHFIKKAKEKRQIILITHNPNLAVVCDAEQIIHLTIDKQNSNKLYFNSGAIEDSEIAKKVVNILEGTKPAFDNRRLKYSSIIV